MDKISAQMVPYTVGPTECETAQVKLREDEWMKSEKKYNGSKLGRSSTKCSMANSCEC